MSELTATFRAMSNHKGECPECSALSVDEVGFCPRHAEAWARTEGLIAMLAQRERVWVETDSGAYAQVNTMAVDSECIVITTTDGRRVTRTILEGAPKWRSL